MSSKVKAHLLLDLAKGILPCLWLTLYRFGSTLLMYTRYLMWIVESIPNNMKRSTGYLHRGRYINGCKTFLQGYMHWVILHISNVRGPGLLSGKWKWNLLTHLCKLHLAFKKWMDRLNDTVKREIVRNFNCNLFCSFRLFNVVKSQHFYMHSPKVVLQDFGPRQELK